jgi:hypothetical protein
MLPNSDQDSNTQESDRLESAAGFSECAYLVGERYLDLDLPERKPTGLDIGREYVPATTDEETVDLIEGGYMPGDGNKDEIDTQLPLKDDTQQRPSDLGAV